MRRRRPLWPQWLVEVSITPVEAFQAPGLVVRDASTGALPLVDPLSSDPVPCNVVCSLGAPECVAAHFAPRHQPVLALTRNEASGFQDQPKKHNAYSTVTFMSTEVNCSRTRLLMGPGQHGLL